MPPGAKVTAPPFITELWVTDAGLHSTPELGIIVVQGPLATVIPLTESADRLLRCAPVQPTASGVADLAYAPVPPDVYSLLLWMHVALVKRNDGGATNVAEQFRSPLTTEHGSALFELHFVDAVLVRGTHDEILSSQFDCFLDWTVGITDPRSPWVPVRPAP